jgi:HAD superfamily hydrolase (TIGR01509 family)
MDDLLVRSGPLWRVAEAELIERLGSRWSAELAQHYKGMNTLDVARTVHGVLKPAMSVEACQGILRGRLIEEFGKGVKAMPGAVELVRHLRGRYPLALASGSPMEGIELALGQLGVHECFDQVISSESVKRGKPEPDVFLAAARLLGAAPAECVVFEDSLVGVRAAVAAGMGCYAVPSGNAEQIRALATRVMGSLAEAVGDLRFES